MIHSVDHGSCRNEKRGQGTTYAVPAALRLPCSPLLSNTVPTTCGTSQVMTGSNGRPLESITESMTAGPGGPITVQVYAREL